MKVRLEFFFRQTALTGGIMLDAFQNPWFGWRYGLATALWTTWMFLILPLKSRGFLLPACALHMAFFYAYSFYTKVWIREYVLRVGEGILPLKPRTIRFLRNLKTVEAAPKVSTPKVAPKGSHVSLNEGLRANFPFGVPFE